MDNPLWLLTKYFRICVNINLSSTTSWRWSRSAKFSQFVFPPHPLNLKYYLPPVQVKFNFKFHAYWVRTMHYKLWSFHIFVFPYKETTIKKKVIHDNKTLWRNSKKRVTLNVSREPNADCWEHLFTSQMTCYLPVNPHRHLCHLLLYS